MGYILSIIAAYGAPIIGLSIAGRIILRKELRLSFSDRFVFKGRTAQVTGITLGIFSLSVLLTIIIIGAQMITHKTP